VVPRWKLLICRHCCLGWFGLMARSQQVKQVRGHFVGRDFQAKKTPEDPGQKSKKQGFTRLKNTEKAV
jgi:hypothetical protein